MSYCVDPLKFKGVCHFTTTDIINNIELNLKLRLDWSMLKIGGFINVVKGMPGPSDIGDWSKLKPIDDDGYRWISIRKEWVYENVDYTDVDSNVISPSTPIIYVDDIVIPSSEYSINYAEGMVIFDDPVDLSAVVQAVHSYRYVQTYISSDVPWWRELQQKSFDLTDIHFEQSTCGDWNIGSQHRVQMPTIIIDAIPTCSLSGYALGESQRKAYQGVLFHIFAETKAIRNRLVDIIRLQGETSICTFNANYAALDSALPFTCDDSQTGLDYSGLVDEYPWHKIWLGKPLIRDLNTLKCGLYEAKVDIPVEVVFVDCGV